MKSWSTWSMVAVAIAAIACGGSSKPASAPAPVNTPDDPAPPMVRPSDPDGLPPIPPIAVAAPAGLVAEAHLPAVPGLLPGLAAYVDALKPGMGTVVSIDMIKLFATQAGLDLTGVDLTRPAHLLILDPTQHPTPALVVVAVADRDALAAEVARHPGWLAQYHDGYAAIGTRPVLVAGAGYALTTLVASPAPREISMSFAMATLVERYRAEIDAGFAQMIQQAAADQRQAVVQSVDSYRALLPQLDRVTSTVAVDGANATWQVRIAAKPDTTLAALIAAQRPGSFGLIEELPAAPITMGGRLELGAVWDMMMALSHPQFTTMYGNSDAATAMMARWRTLMTGENAVALGTDAKGVVLTGLWDTDQPAAVAAMWSDYAKSLSKTPLTGRLGITIKPRAGSHRGAALSTISSAPGPKATAEERAGYDLLGGKVTMGYAVSGPRFFMTSGGDALRLLKAAIDRSASKTRAIDPTLAPVVADLRQRGESYFIAVDLVVVRDIALGVVAMAMGNPLPKPATTTAGRPPAVLAIGTDAGALTLRVAVPPAQVAPLLP